MKMNVVDKTERIEIGNIVELRGNFKEVVRDEEVGYECDYYRTTDKTATFEELHKQDVAKQAQKQLDDTDWIVAKCTERGLKVSEEYPELYVQREEWRQDIRDAR